MDRKHLNSILLFLALVAPFMAKADRFYIEPVGFEPGTTESLQFILENSQEFYGFQAEVKLPEGIEALKGNDGELDITLSERADEGDFRVNSNMLPDGSLILGAFSASHKAFTGNDGVLVNLKVSVADDFAGGSIEISDILFIDYQNQDVEFDSTSSAIGVLATGITLNEAEITLTEGESATLTATINPASVTDKSVIWKSSDEAVATVSPEGVVTAAGVGTATVTVNTSNGKTASCNVTVKAKPIEVSGITLSVSELNLTKGETAELTATVTPEDATDKSVVWTSSDTDVATVSDYGVVTAVGGGNATVTATASNGMTATCTVTVEITTIEVSGITLNVSELTLTEGETATLTATITPEDAADKSVTWASSDTAVATVSDEGVVTAVKAGSTIILALSSNSKIASCMVTVEPKPIEVTGITLNESELTLTEGETAQLMATLTPEDAADRSVAWTSSDIKVATVSAEGVVTAVASGTATVTATASNGMTATCTVTVEALRIYAESLSIDPTLWNISDGTEFTITATVLPENATDKTVTFESSDTSVATVDAEGHVSVLRDGSCIITVSTVDGSDLKAKCEITKTTGIDAVLADPKAEVDVFDIHGILIKRSCTNEQLKQLKPAVYIIRSGDTVGKIAVH